MALGADSVEPLVQSYKKVCDKVLSTVRESKPKEQKYSTENWDDIIDEMNEELSDEDIEPYEEDDEEEMAVEEGEGQEKQG